MRALTRLVQFSFRSKIFFKITIKYERFYKKIGFPAFIRVLTTLGYSGPWSRYVLLRQHHPDFFVSLLSLGLLPRRTNTILDLGCGVGLLFPYYHKSIVGIDHDFVSLYIARLFFTDTRTLLISTNLEKGIPLKNNSVEFVISSDVINYVKNKKLLINESIRSLRKSGVAAYVHIVNRNTTPPGLGILPHHFISLLSHHTMHYSCLGDRYIWTQIANKRPVLLLPTDKHAKLSHAYNVFFSIRRLPTLIRMPHTYDNLLKLADRKNYKGLI